MWPKGTGRWQRTKVLVVSADRERCAELLRWWKDAEVVVAATPLEVISQLELEGLEISRVVLSDLVGSATCVELETFLELRYPFVRLIRASWRGGRSGAAAFAAPRILIVEDDANSRSALRDLLEEEGYVVETASRGDTALACQRAVPPDLILADLVLPDLDGVVVARTTQAETGCAVVLMTGSERARYEDLRFDLVMKPIDFEQLLAAMRYALGARTV